MAASVGKRIVEQWVRGQLTKKADDGIMITLPDQKKVNLNVSITMDRLLRNGIDPETLTNVKQVDNFINQLNSMLKPKVISQDDPRFEGIMETLVGRRSADVMDMQGKKIDTSKGIMGGEEIKPIVDESDAAIKARLDKGNKKGIKSIKISLVDDSIAKIKSLEPMEAMKEANLVAGKKGRYSNLDDTQVKKIIDDTNDHIFERDIPDEDFATGGRAGFSAGSGGRRAFLKLLASIGGATAAAKSGMIGFGKGAGKKVTKEVAQQSTTTPPPYFFKLVEKIKLIGDDVTVGSSTMPRTKVTRYKDYELTEDLASGSQEIKKMGVEDDMITKNEYMTYTKGQADETTKGKKPPDNYEEVTESNSRIYKDNYNDPDYQDGIELKEILEEVGDSDSLTIKKASGGIARMLGE